MVFLNDNVSLNNFRNAPPIVLLGTCSTSSATAAKEVTLPGFELVTGATIQVTFTNANTADTPTLNVNNTDAKAIYNEAGTAVSATNPAYFPANSIVEFIYDGTTFIFKKRVIENYINGSSWYRIYSDGWKEQGGVASNASGSVTSVDVTYPLAFKNTNYSIHQQPTGSIATDSVQVRMISCLSQSTTGCVLYVLGNNSNKWQASGY